MHIEIDHQSIPRTINRGVKVHMIAQKHITGGEDIETIADHYGITRADVYAALAYDYDNQTYFEQRERDLQPLIEAAKRQTDELNAKIRQRMQRKD